MTRIWMALLLGLTMTAFTEKSAASDGINCAEEFIAVNTRNAPFGGANVPTRIMAEVNDVVKNGKADVLLDNDDFYVVLAKGSDIPLSMDEVGRRRAITFENANEGVEGASRDSDKFDLHYQQMLIIKKEDGKPTGEIMGGMRIGEVDEIMQSPDGVRGLYTSDQIEYVLQGKMPFFDKTGKAVELGRSFMIKEAEGSGKVIFDALAAYLVKNPGIKSLFGVVSVSKKNYANSIDVIFEYLKRNSGTDYHGMMTARNPPKLDVPEDAEKLFAAGGLNNFGALRKYVKEKDGIDLPPLLSFYTGLGGQYPAFDHDVAFRVYDGLVVVNLHEVNPAVLLRFMGKENGRKVLEAQGRSVPERKRPDSQ